MSPASLFRTLITILSFVAVGNNERRRSTTLPSILNGIALAFISYAAIKICTGKIDSTSPAIWVIAILSVVSFAVS